MAKKQLVNDKGYSLSVAAWVADDDYDHNPVDGPYFSVTGLIKPIKQIVMAARGRAAMVASPGDNTIPMSRLIASRLGTAVHSGIENTWIYRYKQALRALGYNEATIAKIRVNPEGEDRQEAGIIPVYMEIRSFIKIGKYTVGGKFDFCGGGVLEDFKSMGAYGYLKGDKEEDQRLQGSMYRVLNQDIIKADYMLIQQIITDWSKLDARIQKKRGYPQDRIVAKKVDLMSIEETSKWMHDKLTMIDTMANVPEEELPPCTPEELWQDAPVYKYYKNPEKTKRSSGNFNNIHEAEAKKAKCGGVGIIKEIHGMIKKCPYCDAIDICQQAQSYITAGTMKFPE